MSERLTDLQLCRLENLRYESYFLDAGNSRGHPPAEESRRVPLVPVDLITRAVGEIRALRAELAEARALLAEFVAGVVYSGTGDGAEQSVCLWCGKPEGQEHDEDCPYARAKALLSEGDNKSLRECFGADEVEGAVIRQLSHFFTISYSPAGMAGLILNDLRRMRKQKASE